MFTAIIAASGNPIGAESTPHATDVYGSRERFRTPSISVVHGDAVDHAIKNYKLSTWFRKASGQGSAVGSRKLLRAFAFPRDALLVPSIAADWCLRK